MIPFPHVISLSDPSLHRAKKTSHSNMHLSNLLAVGEWCPIWLTHLSHLIREEAQCTCVSQPNQIKGIENTLELTE